MSANVIFLTGLTEVLMRHAATKNSRSDYGSACKGNRPDLWNGKKKKREAPLGHKNRILQLLKNMKVAVPKNKREEYTLVKASWEQTTCQDIERGREGGRPAKRKVWNDLFLSSRPVYFGGNSNMVVAVWLSGQGWGSRGPRGAQWPLITTAWGSVKRRRSLQRAAV